MADKKFLDHERSLVAEVQRWREKLGDARLEERTQLQRALNAEAEIQRLTDALQWQPIETAPKDGTWVLLLWPEWWRAQRAPAVISRWQDLTLGAGWEGIYSAAPSPTHWMPLVPADALKTQTEKE